MDNFARRDRDIFADLERPLIDLGRGKATLPAFEVLLEIGQPAQNTLTAGAQRLAQRDRIGHQEVGGGKGVGELLVEKGRLAARHIVDAVDMINQAGEPICCVQIGFLQKIEHGQLVPVGVCKALIGIFRVWLGLGRAIIQTRFDGVSPDFGIALP